MCTCPVVHAPTCIYFDPTEYFKAIGVGIIMPDDLEKRKARALARVGNYFAPAKPRRHMVVHRDDSRCQYCGIRCSASVDQDDPAFLTIDHIIPRSRRGSNSVHNLVVACQVCNCRKADRMPWECGMWPSNGMKGEWKHQGLA